MPDFQPGNKKEYKVKAIQYSIVYAKKVDAHLPGLYYLIAWKGYPKKKNTWEPFSIVMQLWKIVSIFYKNNFEKPIAISTLLDFAPPMAKSKIQLLAKWK